MNPHPAIVATVFASDPVTPVARLVHFALAALADDRGHVETTVHTLEHMTGLLAIAIEAILGVNHLGMVLIPAAVTLDDGIIVADLDRHGPIPDPTINVIQVLALRCADAALELQDLSTALAAARGEQL